MNHLVGLKNKSREELEKLSNLAASFKKGKKCQINKKAFTLFFEPSTRTKLSFQVACSNLGIKTFDLPQSSSMQKGESEQDTLKTVDAMRPDAIVVRHSSSGFAEYATRQVRCSVINAGDGSNEHPTQGLLDLMTVKESLGRLTRLNILIVGDILNSRVARSNIWSHKMFGNSITLFGPKKLVPKELECEIATDLDSGLKKADVVMVLRIQFERHKRKVIGSVSEYRRNFGLTKERAGLLKSDAIIMHPGPVNSDVEIDSSLVYSEKSVIQRQVENGVYARMAVLYELLS